MANKIATITQPVSSDVTRIEIRCDGAGNITLLTGSVDAASDDASVTHEGTFAFDVSNLPAAAQTAVTDLVAECLTRFNSEHGF